jgi:hypothetical protein
MVHILLTSLKVDYASCWPVAIFYDNSSFLFSFFLLTKFMFDRDHVLVPSIVKSTTDFTIKSLTNWHGNL